MTAHSEAAEGLISLKSNHSVKKTADKLESILVDKGFRIVARIDHTAAAKKVGVSLRGTELLIFGNPRAGSPLMACEQSIAIDLPQKALISEDEDGNTWLSYNDPAYLKSSHKIEGCDALLMNIASALKIFAHAAKR